MRPVLAVTAVTLLLLGQVQASYYYYDGVFAGPEHSKEHYNDYHYYLGDEEHSVMVYNGEDGPEYSSEYSYGYEDLSEQHGEIYESSPYAWQEEWLMTDCVESEDGVVNITGPVCDITLSGADGVADKLAGGIDGEYQVRGCRDGRPIYVRTDSPKDQDRTLWYSKKFMDWSINVGSDIGEAGEESESIAQNNSVMYGGGDGRLWARPNFISQWSLPATYASDKSSAEWGYIKVSMAVMCTNGQVLDANASAFISDETEMEHRAEYTRYGYKRRSHPWQTWPILPRGSQGNTVMIFSFSSSSSSFLVGAIVGVVASVAVLLLLVLALCCAASLVLQWRAKHSDSMPPELPAKHESAKVESGHAVFVPRKIKSSVVPDAKVVIVADSVVNTHGGALPPADAHLPSSTLIGTAWAPDQTVQSSGPHSMAPSD